MQQKKAKQILANSVTQVLFYVLFYSLCLGSTEHKVMTNDNFLYVTSELEQNIPLDKMIMFKQSTQSAGMKRKHFVPLSSSDHADHQQKHVVAPV